MAYPLPLIFHSDFPACYNIIYVKAFGLSAPPPLKSNIHFKSFLIDIYTVCPSPCTVWSLLRMAGPAFWKPRMYDIINMHRNPR